MEGVKWFLKAKLPLEISSNRMSITSTEVFWFQVIWNRMSFCVKESLSNL